MATLGTLPGQGPVIQSGQFTTTDSSQSYPNAAAAVSAQSGQQQGYTNNYSQLIQEALSNYATQNPNIMTAPAQAAQYATGQVVGATGTNPLSFQGINAGGSGDPTLYQFGAYQFKDPNTGQLLNNGQAYYGLNGDPSSVGTVNGGYVPANAANQALIEQMYGANGSYNYNQAIAAQKALQGQYLSSIPQYQSQAATPAQYYNWSENPQAAALQNASGQLGNVSGQASSAAGNATNLNLNNNVSSNAYLPYMQTGSQANNQLASLLGLGSNPMSSQQIYDQYLNNPAVQLQMQQGNAAINANYGARGLLGSSELLKSLDSFGQGVAAQTLGQYQSQLYNLAGLGANAANQYASNLLSNYGTNIQAQLNAGQLQNSLLNTANSAAMNQGQLANTALAQQSNLAAQAAQAQAQLNTQASLARMSTTANSLMNQNSTSNTLNYTAPMNVGDNGLMGIGASALLGAMFI